MKPFLIAGVFVLAVSVSMSHGTDTPSFEITTKREDDRVEVKSESGKVVFSIHSPVGISHAVIERKEKKWPDAVVLRLHLKGLENFEAANGKVRLAASVSSQDGKVRLWKDGKENLPLDRSNLDWMNIQMIGSDGKPTRAIPLKDGYFEMTLPKTFLEGNPDAITVHWIDFYRT